MRGSPALRRWARIACWALGGLALVVTVVFILHGPILTWVGTLLVVEDELVEADVILPLAARIAPAGSTDVALTPSQVLSPAR